MTVGVVQAVESLRENMVGGTVSSPLCWVGMFIFSCPLTSVLLGLQPSDSDQDLHHPPPDSQAYGLRLGHVLLVPFVLRPSDLSRMTLRFLVLQIPDSRLWDFSAPITMLTSSYTQSPPVYVYISNWSCFCRNPNTVSHTFSDLPGLIWLQGQADTEQILLLSQHSGEETDQRSWAAVWGNSGPLTTCQKPLSRLGKNSFSHSCDPPRLQQAIFYLPLENLGWGRELSGFVHARSSSISLRGPGKKGQWLRKIWF